MPDEVRWYIGRDNEKRPKKKVKKKAVKRKPPVKMRAVGWGVHIDGDTCFFRFKNEAEHFMSKLGGTVVRLYVRRDK